MTPSRKPFTRLIPIEPRCPDCEAKCQYLEGYAWRCPWTSSTRGRWSEVLVLRACDWPYKNPDQRRAS